MTPRQSNIIFYSVISIICYALVIHYFKPDFFANFVKSHEERSITQAINKGEHKKAMGIYQNLLKARISEGDENTAGTGDMYIKMAKLYAMLGDKNDAKNYYLKAIKIKQRLKKVDTFGLAEAYDKLAGLAEVEKNYDEAQSFYEKSLAIKLGTNEEREQGMITGMHNERLDYVRLNNEHTIANLIKLAEIHTLKREYDIAKHYYDKALTASKLTFGEDDIKTTELMNAINQLPKY